MALFVSSGPGDVLIGPCMLGQKKNKTANACRIQHPDSGAMATGQERRSRQQNLKAAMHRLVETGKFRIWHAKKVAEIEQGISVEELVKQQMADENLKVEVKESGKWTNE